MSGILLAQDRGGEMPVDTLPVGIDSSLFYPPTSLPENRLRSSRSLLNQNFDFHLEPVSEGKFQINITGDMRAVMDIKVYDIIGNLLYEDRVPVRGFLQKELDLSSYKSNFFIVEISNQDENKTKSIVAL